MFAAGHAPQPEAEPVFLSAIFLSYHVSVTSLKAEKLVAEKLSQSRERRICEPCANPER